MEQLFNDLQTHIAEKLGNEISLIDEDYGQLEALQNGEDQYPVTFPCVLIGMPTVQWRDLKSASQLGTLSLTVRLAFDCYDDTHYGSTQQQAAAGRMTLSNRLNACINGWKFNGCARSMRRLRTQCYSLPRGIKVYEHTYETEVEDLEVPLSE